MSSKITIFTISLLALAFAQSNAPPVVETPRGKVQGEFCPGGSAAQFLSIRYAQPPVRFSAPQPYNTSYNGTFLAVNPAPSCPQFGAFFIESNIQSEDW